MDAEGDSFSRYTTEELKDYLVLFGFNRLVSRTPLPSSSGKLAFKNRIKKSETISILRNKNENLSNQIKNLEKDLKQSNNLNQNQAKTIESYRSTNCLLTNKVNELNKNINRLRRRNKKSIAFCKNLKKRTRKSDQLAQKLTEVNKATRTVAKDIKKKLKSSPSTKSSSATPSTSSESESQSSTSSSGSTYKPSELTNRLTKLQEGK